MTEGCACLCFQLQLISNYHLPRPSHPGAPPAPRQGSVPRARDAPTRQAHPGGERGGAGRSAPAAAAAPPSSAGSAASSLPLRASRAVAAGAAGGGPGAGRGGAGGGSGGGGGGAAGRAAGPGQRRAAMAGAAGPPLPRLLLLLLQLLALPAGRAGPDSLYVSEYFSQSAQKLSFYSWYGNAKLFHFHVPEDTVLLRWLLQASRGKGPECTSMEITVHFRHGAPPVINPLGTRFPANATVRPSYNISITLGSAVQNTTFVNVTTPAAGDWFIAAHLPQAAGRIEVKADMFVLRLTDMPVLEPGVPMPHTVVSPAKPLHVKVFVPKHAAGMRLQLSSCVTSEQRACTVRVLLGSITLPQSFQRSLTCTGSTNCSLALESPPWEKWLQIMVESLGTANASVSVEMLASFTVCRPGSTSSFLNFISLNQSQAGASPGAAGSSAAATGEAPRNASGQRGSCLQSQPVVREDLDVVSVRYRLLNGPSVPVSALSPTLLLLNLNTGMDSGGSLVVSLLLNKTSVSLANATVAACVSAASPVLSLNATQNCSTAFSQGYPLSVSTSSAEATLIVLYPQTDDWFLSLQLLCPKGQGECASAEGRVTVFAYLTPCFNDCGPYGQCSLLRRHGYLYAGCSCKAGWGGWSCTDDTKAQTVGTQNLATLLLTLSNLMFLPAIAVAVYRFYLVEASVYTYTMFFSTFYHACDQPGVAVMCIMDYDTLQYCDFLGSVVSIWVTILCMARLKKILKYVLFVLGTLLIAMSLQLDRRGVWNMMGPCLFALLIMITAWVHHGAKRRHCYPSSWKRWVFYLLPGITLAFIAISVYAFMETNENYYYTHSIWHVLVACSVAFLLPPRDKHKKPWAWSQKLTCRYQICQNDREELYAVT
ncbi:post-GPI attachment to proteins factor 6 isoform X2 [Motacilla alba alba]|uniref:post-GPI attachment to proteins factor 6 isoform X2 n=1 Tax=Motacilla alba alba TaxID=1094192 RepID=UPI0018D53519|nr:post-GPI attachment to proteins factor 6 isoform X2 [Motacilla alba alba]